MPYLWLNHYDTATVVLILLYTTSFSVYWEFASEANRFRSQSQLEEIEKSLVSGKIDLQEYEIRKSRIQKQISEYQSKLEDKASKLQDKEQELEQMTKNIARVGRVAQPFRNHKIDFEPPRITGKPPIFGVDKWIEEQNRSIASRFVKIVRQIEELYRKDAEQQIQAVQKNALLDYREHKWLQQEYARLTELNDNQTEQMQTFLDQLAEPSVRERIFFIADALIGGQPCRCFIRRRRWQRRLRPSLGRKKAG